MNRVHSYSDGGLALSGSGKGVTALRRFQKDLGAAMDDVGIGHLKRDAFRPHVTLLYGNEPIASADISPIWWTVRDFVLVRSIQGKSRHVVLGNWQLHEKQMRLEGF